MVDDFLDNLTSLTSNMDDISFNRYVTVTQVNSDGTVDCREDDLTMHNNVINTTNLRLSVDDVVLLGFVNNNVYEPMVLGGVSVACADDNMIYALGLGKFNINGDGDLTVDLGFGVSNYFSIVDGDLLVDLESSSDAEKFSINEDGVLVYED